MIEILLRSFTYKRNQTRQSQPSWKEWCCSGLPGTV